MAPDELPQIAAALDPIRAAIHMVADGSARRITVYTAETARLLPAARLLARAAGVAIESADDADQGRDRMVVAAPPRIA